MANLWRVPPGHLNPPCSRGLQNQNSIKSGADHGGDPVFSNANFFNFAPLAAAVEMLGDIGIERIAAHDQQLIDELIESLDRSKYELLSPASGERRSTLVYLTHRDPDTNERVAQGLKQRRISIAQRRQTPHRPTPLHNSSNDITRLTEALSELG
jgi:selenocysteine lyase/cysteine desulfurase